MPDGKMFSSGRDAAEILGRARLDSDTGTGHRALWRQHVLRGSAQRRRHHHPRRRHRPARAGPCAAGGIQEPAAEPHPAADAHALGPHPGPAVFRADLRSALPAADSGLRRRAQRPGQRADRPDGKHLFSRAVRQAAQQHRNRGTQGLQFQHRPGARAGACAPIIPACASATGCFRPTA